MRKIWFLSLFLVIFSVVVSVFITSVFAAAGTDTLEGYWKLDETSSGGSDSVVDSSGDAAHGTPSGSTGANNKPQPSTDVPSDMGFPDIRSLNFDGTDDQVQISGLMGTPTNITLTGWAKVTSGASEGEIISIGNVVILRLGGSSVSGHYQYAPSNWHALTQNTNYSDGWHHFAYVVDDTNNSQVYMLMGQVFRQIHRPGRFFGLVRDQIRLLEDMVLM